MQCRWEGKGRMMVDDDDDDDDDADDADDYDDE